MWGLAPDGNITIQLVVEISKIIRALLRVWWRDDSREWEYPRLLFATPPSLFPKTGRTGSRVELVRAVELVRIHVWFTLARRSRLAGHESLKQV